MPGIDYKKSPEIIFSIDIALSLNVYFFDIENIESKSMSMLMETLNFISIISKNRYWSKDNVYAEQNGGQFQFYMGE